MNFSMSDSKSVVTTTSPASLLPCINLMLSLDLLKKDEKNSLCSSLSSDNVADVAICSISLLFFFALNKTRSKSSDTSAARVPEYK